MTEISAIKRKADELSLLQLIPEYRDYVWGGNRLRTGQLTAEAWVIHENNRVISGGPFFGRTLAELVTEYGQELLGRRSIQQTGKKFPLLIKLLDCAEWLSIQVHPNDEQATRLEGTGHFGKTEAWHVLDAEVGATIIAGAKPNITQDMLIEGIQNGTIVDQLQVNLVSKGDTIFINPGTLHALGPGLLIYEIQQTSDLTYRVFDWNRPLTTGRNLHITKSLAVSDPFAVVNPMPLPDLADGDKKLLTECPYFRLEILSSQSKPFYMDTCSESFHTLTVIEGQAKVTSSREELALNRFDNLIVPACYGAYQIHPKGSLRLLKAEV